MQGRTKLEKHDAEDKLHRERQVLWAEQQAADLYS